MVMPFKSLIFRKETVLEKKDDLFKLLISEKIRPGIQIWVSYATSWISLSRGAISFERGWWW